MAVLIQQLIAGYKYINENLAGEYFVLSFTPNIKFRIKDIMKYKKAIVCDVAEL